MRVKKGSLCSDVSSISFSNKRGQVTVFIIIGIVILFTFAGVFYFTQFSVKDEIVSEADIVIASVPTEFEVLKVYTENCIEDVAKTGLKILGQQGGYIYPDLVGTYSKTKPTDADGLILEPSKVPYWHYNVKPNRADKIVFSSLQPELSSEDNDGMSIEEQLARYVEENLIGCLDNYHVFENQGFNFKFDNNKRVVTTKVTDNSVNFLLEMPFVASKGSAETSFLKFFVKIPIALKHYYEVADQITNTQSEFNFLEKQGMELVSIYSQKDPKYLAPTSDVGYELFAPFSWHETDLKRKIKNLLTSYVSMLQFLGSKNFYYKTFPEGNLLTQAVIDNMVLTLNGADDVDVNFDYFGWELYFDVNSEEGIVRPEHTFVNFGILNMASQRYETHYDVSYPVLVTIKDEVGLDGKPYSFVFALESNIRNNRPPESGEFIEKYPTQLSSLACGDDQKDTGLIKTVVVDSFTKEPVELVRLGFTIPNQAECEIGFTDNSGESEEKYPSTYGGVINFVKKDYLTSFYPIDTYKYKDSDALIGYAISEVPEPAKVVEIHKIKNVNIKVKKKEVKKCLTPLHCEYTEGLSAFLVVPYRDISCEAAEQQCFFDGNGVLGGGEHVISLEANGSLTKYNDYYFVDQSVDLGDNEQAMVTFERVNGFHDEIVGEEFFVNADVKGIKLMEVQLVPGIYKVTGMVTLDEEITIPAESRCFNYDILAWTEDECYTLEENKFDQYISGNLQWDTAVTYLEITPEMLYTSDELTVYVPTQDIKSIPLEVDATAEKCGGYLCVAGVCLYEACVDEDIKISGRLIEDIQVPSILSKVSREKKIRGALEPMFS